MPSVPIRKPNPRNQALSVWKGWKRRHGAGRGGGVLGWAPDLLVSTSIKTAASWRSELVPLLLETGDQEVDRGLQLLLALVGTRLSTALL